MLQAVAQIRPRVLESFDGLVFRFCSADRRPSLIDQKAQSAVGFCIYAKLAGVDEFEGGILFGIPSLNRL
jgi:hypothetical protein